MVSVYTGCIMGGLLVIMAMSLIENSEACNLIQKLIIDLFWSVINNILFNWCFFCILVKCYETPYLGGTNKVVDCKGNCVKQTEKDGQIRSGCNLLSRSLGCEEHNGIKECYCDSDLCNSNSAGKRFFSTGAVTFVVAGLLGQLFFNQQRCFSIPRKMIQFTY